MPPATKENLVGQKFNRFTVISRTVSGGGRAGATAWLCRCDCGNERIVGHSVLKNGGRKSCGCLRNDFHKLDPRGRFGKTEDMTGRRFGKLVCMSVSHSDKNGHYFWTCKCDCGQETVTQAAVLKRGDTLSCGCLSREIRTKHGNSKRGESGLLKATKEYRTWTHIKDRCHNPKCRSYPDYGARGITVWDGWLNDFSSFLEHVGECPSPLHSLDRIDCNLGYQPGNVRWADPKQQARNRRNTIYVEYLGTKMPLAEACEKLGLKYETARYNIQKRGISFDRFVEMKKPRPEERGLNPNQITLVRR